LYDVVCDVVPPPNPAKQNRVHAVWWVVCETREGTCGRWGRWGRGSECTLQTMSVFHRAHTAPARCHTGMGVRLPPGGTKMQAGCWRQPCCAWLSAFVCGVPAPPPWPSKDRCKSPVLPFAVARAGVVGSGRPLPARCLNNLPISACPSLRRLSLCSRYNWLAGNVSSPGRTQEIVQFSSDV